MAFKDIRDIPPSRNQDVEIPHKLIWLMRTVGQPTAVLLPMNSNSRLATIHLAALRP